jgi:hypothetical protein
VLSVTGGNNTEFVPYVNHEDAVKYMKEASLLLLIIPDHRSNKSIITGKLFEYLASARPVLCIGPVDGDAADILGMTGNGRTAEYNDADGICSIIEEYSSRDYSMKLVPPSEFGRDILTGKLASLLEGKT